MTIKTIKDYQYLLFFVAIIWLLEFVNFYLQRQLNQFGLLPRDFEQWYGVVTMHFLHAGMTHLVANTLPFLVLGFLVCLSERALAVTGFIAFASGCLVWAVGRNGIHIGTSAIVMGYLGYLLANAVFNRSLVNLLIMFLAAISYGSLLYVLLDLRDSISFEGHILGFLSGVVAAKLFPNQNAFNFNLRQALRRSSSKK